MLKSLKSTIIKTLDFRYYNSIKRIYIIIDASDYIVEEVFYQYNDKKYPFTNAYYNKNMLVIEYIYNIHNKQLLIII